MSDNPKTSFNVEGARAAGYTDEEISEYLGKTRGFDISKAKAAGHSPAQVIQHAAQFPIRLSFDPSQGREAKEDVKNLPKPPGPDLTWKDRAALLMAPLSAVEGPPGILSAAGAMYRTMKNPSPTSTGDLIMAAPLPMYIPEMSDPLLLEKFTGVKNVLNAPIGWLSKKAAAATLDDINSDRAKKGQ